MLNGRGWNQGDALQRFDQQPGVDELVGKQRIVPVIEDGAHLHCSGSGVDLVVDSQQFPGGDLGLRGRS